MKYAMVGDKGRQTLRVPVAEGTLSLRDPCFLKDVVSPITLGFSVMVYQRPQCSLISSRNFLRSLACTG